MTVAVTGGSGVVGTALIRHLVESGERVVALSRSIESDRALSSGGVEPRRGDILDHGSLVAAFSGSEIVFHVAGVNEMCLRDPSPMYRANVDGTRTVLRACAAAGARRLVYTSSAVVIGEALGAVGDEKTPHRGYFLSHYEESKFQAEQALFQEHAGVEVVAVNPSSVQGPGRATGTGKIIVDVLSGRLRFLADSTISIVDIDDCARGHIAAARRGVAGDRYILSGFTTTVAGAVDAAATALGRPVEPRLVPVAAVRSAATVAEVAFRAMRRRPPVCREMARVLAHGHRYDGSKATRDLGLVYTPAKESLGRMVAWFVETGLVAS